mmetsp:Transcript_10542/g.33442  ORF Transcript_10542/g.33442 Transcript_10542/m.33442 type:complete len:460 (-) Transcript_10542:306-1685(-)
MSHSSDRSSARSSYCGGSVYSAPPKPSGSRKMKQSVKLAHTPSAQPAPAPSADRLKRIRDGESARQCAMLASSPVACATPPRKSSTWPARPRYGPEPSTRRESSSAGGRTGFDQRASTSAATTSFATAPSPRSSHASAAACSDIVSDCPQRCSATPPPLAAAAAASAPDSPLSRGRLGPSSPVPTALTPPARPVEGGRFRPFAERSGWPSEPSLSFRGSPELAAEHRAAVATPLATPRAVYAPHSALAAVDLGSLSLTERVMYMDSAAKGAGKEVGAKPAGSSCSAVCSGLGSPLAAAAHEGAGGRVPSSPLPPGLAFSGAASWGGAATAAATGESNLQAGGQVGREADLRVNRSTGRVELQSAVSRKASFNTNALRRQLSLVLDHGDDTDESRAVPLPADHEQSRPQHALFGRRSLARMAEAAMDAAAAEPVVSPGRTAAQGGLQVNEGFCLDSPIVA